MGELVKFKENLFELVMKFDEIATSNPNLKIHFYVFKYNGELEGKISLSNEIEGFTWYDTKIKDIKLSNTLKNEVIPYCTKNNFIK